MKKHKPGSVVAIEWFDAVTNDGDWADLQDTLKEHEIPTAAITVGIVLKHTDNYIVVARTFQEGNEIVEGTMQILSGMIKSITKLSFRLIRVPVEV